MAVMVSLTLRSTIGADMTRGVDRAEVLAWPASVDLVTAGRAFGLGRTKAHELARAGQFPVRVLRIGFRYRVVTADILAALRLDPAAETPAAGGPVA
jgi:hypothetical protein